MSRRVGLEQLSSRRALGGALGLAALMFGGAASPAPSTTNPGIATTTTAPTPPGALVLYDPAAAALPPAPAANAFVPVTACGGFATPCNGLQTTAATTASVTTPILPPVYGHSYEYGVNGFLSAGVSNHGTGESAGVTAWLKDGDTTLGLTVAVNNTQWNGKGFYPYYPGYLHP